MCKSDSPTIHCATKFEFHTASVRCAGVSAQTNWFAGVNGVQLTSSGVSNDNPEWMVRHRMENNPESVISRHVKLHAFQNREPGIGKPVDFIQRQTALLESGDAPEWMVARNKRIHQDLVIEPPVGRRQWQNQAAPKSYQPFPEPHKSEIRTMSHTSKYKRGSLSGTHGGQLLRVKDLEHKPAGVRRHVHLDGQEEGRLFLA